MLQGLILENISIYPPHNTNFQTRQTKFNFTVWNFLITSRPERSYSSQFTFCRSWLSWRLSGAGRRPLGGSPVECWEDGAPPDSSQSDKKCRSVYLWQNNYIRSFEIEISFFLSPDWCILNYQLDDLARPEDVTVQSLHIAVGDGEVGDLDVVRLPQPHRHAGQVGVLTQYGDALVTLRCAVTGIDSELKEAVNIEDIFTRDLRMKQFFPLD